jgi:tRNA G10  N-methylase Trm11
VLNCYCYTGGFTVAALAGGAGHVTSIDSSGPALEQARANLLLNGLRPRRSDVHRRRRERHAAPLRREGRLFDAIVLDPPKLAPTAAHAERAARPTRTSTAWPSSCCARRRAVHLLLFGRHRRGPVPQDRGVGRPMPAWTAVPAAPGRRPTTR